MFDRFFVVDTNANATPGLERKPDTKQSDTGTNVDLARPSPPNNGKDAPIAIYPCNNKE